MPEADNKGKKSTGSSSPHIEENLCCTKEQFEEGIASRNSSVPTAPINCIAAKTEKEAESIGAMFFPVPEADDKGKKSTGSSSPHIEENLCCTEEQFKKGIASMNSSVATAQKESQAIGTKFLSLPDANDEDIKPINSAAKKHPKILAMPKKVRPSTRSYTIMELLGCMSVDVNHYVRRASTITEQSEAPISAETYTKAPTKNESADNSERVPHHTLAPGMMIPL